MNTKCFLLLLFLQFSLCPMEDAIKQSIINQIAKREITFEDAEPQIDAHCGESIALKAYAKLFLPCKFSRSDRLFELIDSGAYLFPKEQLKKYRQQAAESNDWDSAEVVDLMQEACGQPRNQDTFMSASYLKSEKGARFLLSLGLKPTHGALNVAVCQKSVSMVKLLIDAGVPLDPEPEDFYSMQRHPLRIAAMDHDEAIVALLVRSGTNFNQKYLSIYSHETKSYETRTVYEQTEYELHRYSDDKPQRQKALEILRKYCPVP